MSEVTLPDSPRVLSRATKLGLLFGHPLTLAGIAALGLGSLVVWMLVAGYSLSFSELRAGWGTPTSYLGTVSSVTEIRLWTGEPITLVSATYQGNQTALGYGASGLTAGEQVQVLSGSGQAWLEGMQRFPVPLDTLARISLFFLSPGLLLLTLGLLFGGRLLRLLKCGEQTSARSLRRIPLPRPFKGTAMVRWKSSQGAFWALSDDEAEERTAVCLGSSGVILGVLLPELHLEQECVQGLSRFHRFRAGAGVVLLGLQLVPLFLFLLT